ncbi:MAG: hypothetical protein HY860_00405 [Chlamydiales bacterium]|nr:hypothetical protein [Chlamydiales bacterium]
MRLYSTDTFFKQLSSFHDFHEHLFCIIGPDREDRRDLVHDLVSILNKKHPAIEKKNVYPSEEGLESVFLEMQSIDLFAARRCFVLHHLDECGSKDIDTFLLQLEKLDATQFVVFSSESSAFKTKELNALKDKILILDLSKEKPWDKRKRIIEKLTLFAKKNSKILASEDASKMIDCIGLDISLLKAEVEKLCLLMHGEKRIIFHPSLELQKQDKIWQIADHILLSTKQLGSIEIDQQEFYLITTQIRNRIYLALAILENNESYLKGAAIHESLIAKYKQTFSKLPKNFFLRALTELYHVEYMARQGSMKSKDLLDVLSCKIARSHSENIQ